MLAITMRRLGGVRAFTATVARAHHGAVPRQPAPAFKGAAVVGDAFKDISLSDYHGKCVSASS